jgi:hypothetical protein
MTTPPDLAVLGAIHRSGPVTRREIAAQTGLSLNRISAVVADLLTQRLICEETSQDRLPGRPANLLRVHPEAGYVIGLDIGGEFSCAALTDLAGNLQAMVEQRTEAVPDRNVILDGIAHLVQTVWHKADTMPGEGNSLARKPAALGIGLHGIVDSRSGLVLGWPNTPAWASAWSGVDLAGEIWQRTGI